MEFEEKKLKETLSRIQKKVEPTIKKILIEGVPPRFHKLFLYQLSTGGKRLRPALTIISCQALGGKLSDALYPAAGLEILHNYTLIIDDIIDQSTLRRGQLTVWAKYGSSIADCVSINFAASIFQTAQNKEIAEIYCQTIKKITQGQILDILFERAGREREAYVLKNRPKVITRNDYKGMISKKTALLFQACCQIGATCAGASKKQINALKTYGLNLGMAFQIKDDILDIFGEEEKFSKKGRDIKERKGGNIVLILAKEELAVKERKQIHSLMAKQKITDNNIKRIVSLIEKTNARQRAFQIGEGFIKKAKQALRGLRDSQNKAVLNQIADFVVSRKY